MSTVLTTASDHTESFPKQGWNAIQSTDDLRSRMNESSRSEELDTKACCPLIPPTMSQVQRRGAALPRKVGLAC